ncbi:heavy metal-associated isoprenylated plant protein 21-like [Neltuma alba]|uniref:heavy metal-associated isoprenylated plant protein 21-like n=1 Tax=Neltuma alba TaxID=207710 RepID=UPI0010A482F3|nr:heavy metal-associated isoprenylated plant protein 21-like [Prosopis alba]
MGFLDHLPQCFSCPPSPLHKRFPLQTVNLRVKMDCQGCVRKVRNAVEGLKGVESVDINQKQQRVTVKGHVDAEEVIEEVKSTGKRVESKIGL